jgi:hypothetical protein
MSDQTSDPQSDQVLTGAFVRLTFQPGDESRETLTLAKDGTFHYTREDHVPEQPVVIDESTSDTSDDTAVSVDTAPPAATASGRFTYRADTRTVTLDVLSGSESLPFTSFTFDGDSDLIVNDPTTGATSVDAPRFERPDPLPDPSELDA